MPTPLLRKPAGTTPKGQGGPPRTLFDRSRYSSALQQRTKEAFDKKDSTGKFGSYIKEEYQSKLWDCTASDHLIDIIPYVVGTDHPTLQEGDFAFLLDVYRHGNVGPNADSYICLSRTFNRPCPICEDQRDKRRSGEYSDEDLKPLNPSRRTLYNIWVHDNEKEEGKGTQLWEVAQWYFDKHVNARAKKTRTGELIYYADPINGKAIQFERKGKGMQNTEYLAHTFLDRDYEIPDEILQGAIPLDQIIKIPTYDEVYQAYFGSQLKSKEDIPMAKLPPKLAKEDTPPPNEEGCPYGGEIGVDMNKYEECNECPKWDDCAEAEKQLAEVTPLKPTLTRRLVGKK